MEYYAQAEDKKVSVEAFLEDRSRKDKI